jgi:hypothetical protein
MNTTEQSKRAPRTVHRRATKIYTPPTVHQPRSPDFAKLLKRTVSSPVYIAYILTVASSGHCLGSGIDIPRRCTSQSAHNRYTSHVPEGTRGCAGFRGRAVHLGVRRRPRPPAIPVPEGHGHAVDVKKRDYPHEACRYTSLTHLPKVNCHRRTNKAGAGTPSWPVGGTLRHNRRYFKQTSDDRAPRS